MLVSSGTSQTAAENRAGDLARSSGPKAVHPCGSGALQCLSWWLAAALIIGNLTGVCSLIRHRRSHLHRHCGVLPLEEALLMSLLSARILGGCMRGSDCLLIWKELSKSFWVFVRGLTVCRRIYTRLCMPSMSWYPLDCALGASASGCSILAVCLYVYVNTTCFCCWKKFQSRLLDVVEWTTYILCTWGRNLFEWGPEQRATSRSCSELATYALSRNTAVLSGVV